MITIPTLETERLILRGWRESDVEPYATQRADAHYNRFIGGAMTGDESWRNVAMQIGHWTLRGYGRFVLEEKSSGAYAGYCGPWYPPGFPEPEIGWGLVPSNQGQGYATEAARASLAYAYDKLRWTTAISLIAEGNRPSQRVAERLGARLDGTTEYLGKMCGKYRHPPPAK